MKKKKNQDDFNTITNYLKETDLQELLLRFIEAKTGDEANIDILPMACYEIVEELENVLKEVLDI